MKITVKQQVLLAPALVLFLLTLLLGFMQYTYWDLSVKRFEAKALGTAFISLAEADLASRRIQRLLLEISHRDLAQEGDLETLSSLADLAVNAIERIEPYGKLVTREKLDKVATLAAELDPAKGFELEQMLTTINQFRSEVTQLTNLTAGQRKNLRDLHTKDIDALVEQTALVMTLVLGMTILLGIVLSLYFGRRILSRIQALSNAASRIAAGELEPPPAPERIDDELDMLSLSINRMTQRLIQVVGTEKLFEGAEEERRRIAMDLHDQTLADLSSILRELQTITQNDAAGSQQQALQMEANLTRAIANLRDIMHNLHPQTLDILGFGAALESELEHLAKAPDFPQYHFQYDPRIDQLGLSRLQQLSLYRIGNEALNNVVKHANASRLEICIELRVGQLILSVEDNGCGFVASVPKRSEGRGLNNLRERAKSIGARVEWRPSRFSSGTRFELSLPVTTRTKSPSDSKGQ